MDIAILGAGIDGLLAAHAAVCAGYKPVIYGEEDSQYNPIGVAAHLVRKEIPGITEHLTPDYFITMVDTQDQPGSVESLVDIGMDYHRKVFGKDFEDYAEKYTLQEFDDLVNPNNYIGFDVDQVYSKLWDLYGGHITYQWITPSWYKKYNLRHDYDIIFNTLPMHRWCATQTGTNHTFQCIYYWTMYNAPYGPFKKGDIYLSADPNKPHYMQANLFGDYIVEWPEDKPAPFTGAVRAPRPLGTTCDCHVNVYDFYNVGALASWDHTMPIHQSFYRPLALIEAEANQPQQLDLPL